MIELLKNYWKENKASALTWLIGLLLVLAGLPIAAYNIGQTNPPPEIAIREVQELVARGTVIPTATKASSSRATNTAPVPTATFAPPVTATKTPILVSTSTSPVTLTPVGIVTATPGAATPTALPGEPIVADDGCVITNAWKPPRNEPCGHLVMGANPRDPAIIALFDQYGTPGEYVRWLSDYGEMWQPWVSSQFEITHHWRGFVWILTTNLDCDQVVGIEGAPQACIVWSMDRLHDDGTGEHSLSSRHSLTTHRIVCQRNNATGKPIISVNTCGVYRGGMSQADSDQLQTPYKNFWCDTPSDNPLWSVSNQPDLLDGGVYHSHPTVAGHGIILTGWWFDRPNPVEQANYAYGPNQSFTISFFSQAWQLFQPYLCQWTNNPSLATAAGYDLTQMSLIDAMKAETRKWPVSPEGGHNLWQVFNMRLAAFTEVGSGWTDQNGHIWADGEPDGGCVTPSFYCIPFSVEGHYPLNIPARMARRVDLGACDFTPCVTFPTGGVQLIYPLIDNPTGAPVDHIHQP